MNRAIARRAAFESRADVRYFLSQIARSVRRGEIEVHAFCILATHFHLLVRSTDGRLGQAMQRVQSQYVRWFNRRRDRDGALFRGRFLSRPVASDTYWRVLVRYIDDNSVGAGLARRAWQYAHGSAQYYIMGRGPRWLRRDVVQEQVCSIMGLKSYEPAAYVRAFARVVDEVQLAAVERALRRAPLKSDPIDDLFQDNVRSWLEQRALLADGGHVSLPMLTVSAVLRAVERQRRHDRFWNVGEGRQSRDGWAVLTSGLLRSACGASTDEISVSLRVGKSTAHRYVRLHAALVRRGGLYPARAEEVLRRAAHGGLIGMRRAR